MPSSRTKAAHNATRAQYFPLGGGLDTTTPPLSVNPGRLLAVANFEPWYNGGYRRIPGYERYDGRARPSDATYTGFDVTAIGTMAVGDTLTQAGQTSSVIGNQGFETDVLAAGSFNNSITGWEVSGAAGTYRKQDNDEEYPDPPGVPGGLNVAYTNSSGRISQTLGGTKLALNTKYTLRVYVGRRKDAGQESISFEVNLNADGVTLAQETSPIPAHSKFVQTEVVFTTGSSHAQEGESLEIEFVNTGSVQVNFDDVRLKATHSPATTGVVVGISDNSVAITQVSRAWAHDTTADDITSARAGAAFVKLDLTPTGKTWLTNPAASSGGSPISNGRGLYIKANNTFEVDSIGWYGDIIADHDGEEFVVQIYAGTGETILSMGSPLATSTPVTLSTSAPAFQDIPISYTFESGEEYLIIFRREDNTAGFSIAFDYVLFGDGAEESNLGDVTVLDGRNSHHTVATWINHYRMGIDNSGGPFTMAATPVAGVRQAPTTVIDETFLLAAEDEYRDDIGVVPGSGEVRGVWQLGASVYAWRNDIGGSTACVMHKATAAGWVTAGVTMAYYLRFDAGGSDTEEDLPVVGETVTGAGSGSGVVHRIVTFSGAAANNDATGYIVFTSPYSDSPVFVDNEVLSVGGTAWGLADGVATQFAFPINGHYQFTNHNFLGSSTSYRAFGCNGVGPAFEIDENGHVSPILHAGGSTSVLDGQPANNKPFLVTEHRNYLWLAFPGGSLQHSVLGEPIQWNGFLGAAEFGVGDEITGIVPTTGNVLAVITERESRGLFGDPAGDDLELRIIAEKTGGRLYSVANLDTVYGLDDLGITSIARTDAFGDFVGSTVSQLVQTIVTSLRALVTTATVSRTSSQYRVYFSDKSILCMFVPSVGSATRDRGLDTRLKVEFGYLQYDVAVTRIWNSDDASGVERTYFATADALGLGMVYEDQIGRNFDGAAIDSFCRLPFHHIGTPSKRKRFRRADVEIQAENLVTLKFTADLTYGAVAVSTGISSTVITDIPQLDVIGGGGFWDDANWDEFLWDAQVVATARARITGSGENIGLLIYNTSAKAEPFILQGITLHYDERRLQR